MGNDKNNNKSVNSKAKVNNSNKKNTNEKKKKQGVYQPSRKVKIIMLIILVLQIITAVGFMVYFYKMNMWPMKYLGYVLGVILIITIIAWILKRWKWGCVVSVILSLCMIALQCFGCYIIYVTNNTLSKITEKAETNTDVICVLVLDEDPAKTIEDVKDYEFGILKELDRDNTDSTIDEINKETETEIATTEYDNILNLVAALYSGNVEAIILNNAYRDIVDDFEGYEDFKDEVRSVFDNVITSVVEIPKNENKNKGAAITENTFNVYISGIDVSGDVTTKSRSDVNIIMSVNPKTKQILLVSTPRDYYVPLSISGGVKDKLTHAGLYGVDVSMETLELLYDIEIDYFARMNFTGFTDIIDILGGIEVYSEYSFSAKGYNYNEGYNKLDGKSALVFARERKSFATGDNQRGKNQMEVIKAVIDKAQSAALLTEFTSILDSVSDCMQTDITTNELSQLVKMQLDSGASWNVKSYSVTGSGLSEYTFTVPNAKAYVMDPHQETVEKAKSLFKTVADGGILNEDNEE